MDPWVLPRLFPTIAGRSPGRKSSSPTTLLRLFPVKDLGLKFEERKGPFVKYVTHRHRFQRITWLDR
jgi:hypothetical protein